jgi:hypothetical protein
MVESELVHHFLAVAWRTNIYATDHFATEREEPSTLVTMAKDRSEPWPIKVFQQQEYTQVSG